MRKIAIWFEFIDLHAMKNYMALSIEHEVELEFSECLIQVDALNYMKLRQEWENLPLISGVGSSDTGCSTL